MDDERRLRGELREANARLELLTSTLRRYIPDRYDNGATPVDHVITAWAMDVTERLQRYAALDDENLRMADARGRDAEAILALAERWREQGKDAEADEMLAALSPPANVDRNEDHLRRVRQVLQETLTRYVDAGNVTAATDQVMLYVDGALWGAERETARAAGLGIAIGKMAESVTADALRLRERFRKLAEAAGERSDRLLAARDRPDQDLPKRLGLERAANEARWAADKIAATLEG